MQAKRPVSILAVIHTPGLEVLLLERVKPSQFWQSITGSQEGDETLAQTAVREIREETGFRIPMQSLVDHRLSNRYPIPPEWRGRYGTGVSHNTEHVFSACVASAVAPLLDPAEHRAWQWLPWQEAACRVWSWTNRDAIRLVGRLATSLR